VTSIIPIPPVTRGRTADFYRASRDADHSDAFAPNFPRVPLLVIVLPFFLSEFSREKWNNFRG
jgi:hypothetical protein